MQMTVVVTRKVADRTRGFLASCMLEIAPGVYAQPTMNPGVRDRVWDVLLEWAETIKPGGGIAMFWPDSDAPSGLDMRFIGWPKKEFIEHEGNWLVWQALTQEHDPYELEALEYQGSELPLDMEPLTPTDYIWLNDILNEEE